MRQLTQEDIAGLDVDSDLIDLSFDGLSLVGLDLSDREIVGCSFRDCVLTDAKFNASTIRSCEFGGAGMRGVSLFAARVIDCKMMGLDLARSVRFDAATFSKVNFDYALFRNVDLSDVEFDDCSMRECDLTGADLSNASLVSCDLTDADWSNATTDNTDVRGSSMRGFDLRRGPYGVILTTHQVISLAEELGVTVIDPAEAKGGYEGDGVISRS